jgi:hypothetical protein
MEYSRPSCSVRNAISILSTIDLVRSSHLGKIALETSHVGRWFDADGQACDEEVWEGLDSVLSKLAKATISKGKKRLTFILEVMRSWCGVDEHLTRKVRKQLPQVVPHFNELGLLHVHYGRRSHCRVDGGCLHDKPGAGFLGCF